MKKVLAEPLTAKAFRPFGDVLAVDSAPDMVINDGWCDRFHDRARMDFGPDGRAGISIFKARARSIPYSCDLLERHPDGSQAFVPMGDFPWLVIVAPDVNDTPGTPRAFLPKSGQAINFLRNTWHGVLTPLAEPGLFAVIDRIGPTENLKEFRYSTPFIVSS